MATLLVLAVCVGTVLSAPSSKDDVRQVDLLMPEVQPQNADTYLCHPMDVSGTPQYIVGYQPHANMAIAHHILLYGCKTTGSEKPVWNCGEMASSEDSRTPRYDSKPVCSSGTKILYAWAMDAPPLQLPKDVGFMVGGDTGIDYLVLQVHYKDVTPFLPPKNELDSSGITMAMTNTPQPRQAGVYLMGTGGFIPAHSVTYLEAACPYSEHFDIYPFAFRTHAHSHGQVSSGYRVRNGQWTEIGRMSPQKPQMFYNTSTPGMNVQRYDYLAARCTMKNDLDKDIYIGSTQNDEMCNFYVMYYTENNNKPLPQTYCFSAGHPNYYWARNGDMKQFVNNIPDTASVIPGTNKPLVETAVPGLYPGKPKDQTPALDKVNTPVYNKGSAGPQKPNMYDFDVDPQTLDSSELARLINILQQRGPRAYDEDYYY